MLKSHTLQVNNVFEQNTNNINKGDEPTCDT